MLVKCQQLGKAQHVASVIYLWLMLRHERIFGSTESEECNLSFLESRTRHKVSFLMQNMREILGTHNAFVPEEYPRWSSSSFFFSPFSDLINPKYLSIKLCKFNRNLTFSLTLMGSLLENMLQSGKTVFEIIQAQGMTYPNSRSCFSSGGKRCF